MADRPLRLKPSSNVHSAVYDDATGRCTVTMNGGTHAFHSVPPEKAEKFEEADSPGQFVHQQLKGVHESTRIR